MLKKFEVIRTSMYSGKTNSMTLELDPEMYYKWVNREINVQDAFPHLTADEREFLMTGTMPDEWDKMFPPEEEMDVSSETNDEYWNEWEDLDQFDDSVDETNYDPYAGCDVFEFDPDGRL